MGLKVMQNAKLKIKNGRLEETIEGGRGSIKSGRSAWCLVVCGSGTGKVLEANAAGGTEWGNGEIGEKAHKKWEITNSKPNDPPTKAQRNRRGTYGEW